jgi:serine/threonine-protein phosphatase 6 regulatory ankyrin repeat subunit B
MLRQLVLCLFQTREKTLIRAAEDGRLDLVRTLLEAGADPNAKSEGGFTALMWAAARGHVEVVKALLASGAELNARTRKGRTAVDIATQEGHDDITALLGEAGDRT